MVFLERKRSKKITCALRALVVDFGSAKQFQKHRTRLLGYLKMQKKWLVNSATEMRSVLLEFVKKAYITFCKIHFRFMKGATILNQDKHYRWVIFPLATEGLLPTRVVFIQPWSRFSLSYNV